MIYVISTLWWLGNSEKVRGQTQGITGLASRDILPSRDLVSLFLPGPSR